MEDAIPQGVPGGLEGGHEGTEIRTRGLVIGVAALIGTIVVCQVVLGLWMARFNREEERVNALYPARHAIEVDRFPQPRLQESPSVDTVAILREERARISSYGWVDEKSGIARIPVDRAMDILARKGLPRVAARPRTPGAPPNTTIPPARKREEARPEEDRPATRKKEGSPAPRKTDEPKAPEEKDARPGPVAKPGGKS